MIFSKTEKLTYDMALPIVNSNGYEIYDVEYVKEGPHWFLRVFIDREEGVNIDDCEVISRSLGALLDEKDCIGSNYFLEVSSPGIERNLRHDEHFQSAVGQSVKIKLYKQVGDLKEVEGELIAAEHDKLTVDAQNGPIDVEKKNIAKANILFEF